jgi:hypothetical protein
LADEVVTDAKRGPEDWRVGHRIERVASRVSTRPSRSHSSWRFLAPRRAIQPGSVRAVALSDADDQNLLDWIIVGSATVGAQHLCTRVQA